MPVPASGVRPSVKILRHTEVRGEWTLPSSAGRVQVGSGPRSVSLYLSLGRGQPCWGHTLPPPTSGSAGLAADGICARAGGLRWGCWTPRPGLSGSWGSGLQSGARGLTVQIDRPQRRRGCPSPSGPLAPSVCASSVAAGGSSSVGWAWGPGLFWEMDSPEVETSGERQELIETRVIGFAPRCLWARRLNGSLQKLMGWSALWGGGSCAGP